MGERGARNEPATPEDIAAMAGIVQEAIEAGALGFSTSRTFGHRAMDGEPVPGTFAAEDELFGLGRAMAARRPRCLRAGPAGGRPARTSSRRKKEVEWMQRLGAEIDMPVSFALLQVDAAPDLWRELMDISAAAHAGGRRLYPADRGPAVRHAHRFRGPPRIHPAADLPPADGRMPPRANWRAAGRAGRAGGDSVRGRPAARPEGALRQHERPGSVLAEPDVCTGRSTQLRADSDRAVAAIAGERGEDPLATLYDLMLECDATAMLMLPFFNYSTATTTRSARCSRTLPGCRACPTAARTAA